MQYDTISEVYDRFNDGFDYEKYLNTGFRRFHPRETGLVLDCGCGTGVLMEILTQRGYDCTGVDASERMLEGARERFEKNGKRAHLVCQDLERIDMYGAYDIVFCTLDTVNHILSLRGLKAFFKRLYNFTEPGGSFIFDFKTRDAFELSTLPNISEKDGDMLIVRGQFDGQTAWYDLPAFIRSENGYAKFEDAVEERYYTEETVKEALKEAGFVYGGKIKRKERVIFCARKKEK